MLTINVFRSKKTPSSKYNKYGFAVKLSRYNPNSKQPLVKTKNYRTTETLNLFRNINEESDLIRLQDVLVLNNEVSLNIMNKIIFLLGAKNNTELFKFYCVLLTKNKSI